MTSDEDARTPSQHGDTAHSRQARSVGKPPALAQAPGPEVTRGSARLSAQADEMDAALEALLSRVAALESSRPYGWTEGEERGVLAWLGWSMGDGPHGFATAPARSGLDKMRRAVEGE